jgi:hypothetical protein
MTIKSLWDFGSARCHNLCVRLGHRQNLYLALLRSSVKSSGGLTELRTYIGAPEGMCVNLCFKRKNGDSNHLNEATASKNVIARAQNK